MNFVDLLLVGSSAVALFIIISKIISWKNEKNLFSAVAEDTSNEPCLSINKNMRMTQSQEEKVHECAQEAGMLIGEGFVVTEDTPYKITAVLEKDNYLCEFTNYYEFENSKVKKIVMELTGKWTFGRRTKSIKGRTNNPAQKWFDWDEAYELELEKFSLALEDLSDDWSEEAEWLAREGFVVTEDTPHKVTAVLEKQNYRCEHTRSFELDGKDIKKAIMELTGSWTVGNKTKSISVNKGDLFDAWEYWDEIYQHEFENSDV